MAYTKPVLSNGDVVDATYLDSLLKEFRKELLLSNTQLSDDTITEENIRRPSYRAIGMNAYEWRGVSGGLKYIFKNPAGLGGVEDWRILNKAETGTGTTTAKFREGGVWERSMGQPATNPTNSAVSSIQYSQGSTVSDIGQPDSAPPIPGCSLSVVLDKPCMVRVRCKSIMNWLPGATGSNGDHVEDGARATLQKMQLYYQKPDGTFGRFNGGSTSYAWRCQTNWDFRENYFCSTLQVGDTDLGEWNFFVLVAFQYGETQGTKFYPTNVALAGASSFEVEWFNADVSTNLN